MPKLLATENRFLELGALGILRRRGSQTCFCHSLLPCFQQPDPCSLFLPCPSTQGCSGCAASTAVGFFLSLIFTDSPPRRYSLAETQLGLSKRCCSRWPACEWSAAAPVCSNPLAHTLPRCDTQLRARLWWCSVGYLLCSEGRDFVMFYSASFGRSSDLSSPYISASRNTSLATSPTTTGPSTSLSAPWHPASACPTPLGANTAASARPYTR